ncbi:hypothetical protein KKF04_00130, partial [Patescibacteria group bacterium]|nr:hypothetical protein [Patescibacteria group bacterium]
KLIIGLAISVIMTPVALGEYCDPINPWNTYQSVYCDMAVTRGQKTDDAILETVAKQLEYDIGVNPGALVKFIIDQDANISCKTLDEDFLSKNNIKLDSLPEEFKIVCEGGAATTGGLAVIQSWAEILSKVKTAYEKEKVLHHTKKSLEYEFQASEQFWNGKIDGPGGAQFDLITDLNIIETILFGNQAEWVDDVFQFPGQKDEEEDEGEYDIPVGTQDLASDEEGGEDITEPPTGFTAEVEETAGQEPDCVPADDPDADLGDHPGGDYENPLCGNGELDVLLGEMCDDGNNVSGDGCSQYCMLEETGANDICIDPEAVTFQSPSDAQSDPQSDPQSEPQSEPPSECPPGTLPKTEITITAPEVEFPEYPQSEEYPGPYVGGTFKEYPPSEKPPCQDGYSEVSITFAGGELGSACVPTDYCADFNDARDFLFGEGWQDDAEKADIAYSIEALFCISVTTENRPLTPYALNENCIDCHIRAMVDALDKTLETNVSPLENTTGGFAISSRWGPKFSFNLITAIKSKLKLAPRNNDKSVTQNVDTKTDKDKNAATTAEPNMENTGETGAEELQRKANEEETAREEVLDELKNYRALNSTISDGTFNDRVKPLLEQMLNSFSRIQDGYTTMAETSLDQKETCTFE